MRLKIIVTVVFLFCNVTYIFANSERKYFKEPKNIVWPFEGIFGYVDRASAQRGAKIYFEVCGSCHSMNHLYYRNLENIGFSKAEIKEISRNYEVIDGPNKEGELYKRPAKPSDKFVSPYENEQIARNSNNGSLPPDLSLIIKARTNGADYLYSLLTGYGYDVPDDVLLPEGSYYNPYFLGLHIAMPNPLSEDLVDFDDGTKAQVEQMARDITIFLQWAAEPEMEERNLLAIKVMSFLMIFTLVFFLYKRKIWKNIK